MGQLTFFDPGSLIKEFQLNGYIETGTGLGVSLTYACQFPFDFLMSVELDKEMAETARSNFMGNNKVKITNAHSTEFLELVCQKLPTEQNCLFFLDAHFPEADFGKLPYRDSIEKYGKSALPLDEELSIIKKYRRDKDVIIVDDIMIYDQGNNQYEHAANGFPWNNFDMQNNLGLSTQLKDLFDDFQSSHKIQYNNSHQGYALLTPLL